MKKRILSVVLILAMMLSLMAVPAGAAVTYKDWSNVYWTSADDGLDAIPSQYSFTLADDTKDALGKTPVYQVIDSEEADGKKNYLIIRLEAIAGRGRISTSTSQMYDPEVEGTLAYWMDNIWTRSVESEADYSSVLNVKGTLLNESFKDYLVEHEWVMEKCSAASLEQSSITAKAVIPSASEINYYVTKINGAALSTGTGNNASITRTPKAEGKVVYVQGESATSGKLGMQPLSVNSSDYKRAWGMFWVSEDFFKNVKVSSVGADVSYEICNLNTVEELYALGYSYEELVAMGKIEAGEVPESVEISVEKAVPGYPVSVTVDEALATDETPVVWYVSDTETGEYTAVAGASGNDWAITNSCANKYIKAGVNGVYSNAIAVGAGATTITKWQHGVTATAPVEQYSFRVADSTTSSTLYYTLLDSETVDGKKNYLIIQLGSSAANGTYSTDTANTIWNPEADPQTEKTMAYWLDNYWSQGLTTSEKWTGGSAFTNVLEDKLVPYVKDDHTWLTERSALIPNDYTFKASATVLSIAETVKYADRLYNVHRMILRNGHIGDTSKKRPYAYIENANFAGTTANVGGIATKYIYPIFYLTEDFFKNVKIDINTVGSDVLAEILAINNNSENTLREIGYTDDELAIMGVIEGIDVKISASKAVPGYTVSVTVDDTSTDDEVVWYVADTEDGEYTVIENVTGNSWTIENAYANKYIKVCVDGFYSNVLEIGAGLREFNPDAHGGWTLPKDMPETSPEEYKFTLLNPSNEEFTYHMLETEDVNGETQYFILQMGRMISNGKMVSSETDYKFDPTVSKSAADWLNNIWAVSSNPNMSDYYKTNGGVLNNNGTAIDTNIKPYLQNHTWLTERAGSLVPNDYTFTGKVSLLSVTEFFEHYKKIGKNDYGKGWFRTPTNKNGEARFFVLSENVWAKVAGDSDVNHYYRPVYYLSESFFKNVKLESAGAEVAKMVRSTITKDEMLNGSAGYTEEELTKVFGYGSELTYEENAVIAGSMAVGQKVQARFDGVLEGAMYQWYVADENDGLYERIDGATERSYVIKDADLGRYLAVEIIAFNGEGEMQAPIIGKSDVQILEEKDLTVVFKSSTNENGRVCASFEIKNKKETAQTAVLILAVYDNSGRFVKANYAEEDIVSGTDTYSVTVDSLDTTKTYTYKAMAWDGMSTMTSLCVDEQF